MRWCKGWGGEVTMEVLWWRCFGGGGEVTRAGLLMRCPVRSVLEPQCSQTAAAPGEWSSIASDHYTQNNSVRINIASRNKRMQLSILTIRWSALFLDIQKDGGNDITQVVVVLGGGVDGGGVETMRHAFMALSIIPRYSIITRTIK